MTQNDKVFIGIDVSKATLDIAMSGKHFQIDNTKESISQFVKQEIILKKIAPVLICLESTGGYETIALQCFQAVKMPIHKAHPNRVHAFARASGHFAKTDKLDAKLLEKYAGFVCHEETGDLPLSKTFYDLQELKAVERSLMESLHANQCRVKNSRGPAIDYLKVQINFIQEQLKMIRQDIEKIIDSDDQLTQTRKILMSYKGVAKQVSSTLVIELPELGKLSKREIASLVGVVPKTHESGTKKLNGHISGGRFFIRKALYMAALVASRCDEKMRTFYNRLIAAGKAKKIALVAVMRKIIVCLNAMVKNNKIYEIVVDS